MSLCIFFLTASELRKKEGHDGSHTVFSNLISEVQYDTTSGIFYWSQRTILVCCGRVSIHKGECHEAGITGAVLEAAYNWDELLNIDLGEVLEGTEKVALSHGVCLVGD